MVAALVGAGFGYADVLHMPWTDARDFARSAATATARQQSQAMLQAAIAARMAQAEPGAWKEFAKSISAA